MILGCAACAGSEARPRPRATTDQRPGSPSTTKVKALLESGRAFNRENRRTEAEQVLRRAVLLARELPEHDDQLRAEALAELACTLVVTQRSAEARTLLQQMDIAPFGSIAADTLFVQQQMILAESYRYESESVRAEGPFRRAIEAASRHPAELAARLIEASLRLAAILGSRRAQDAVPLLESALVVAETNPRGATSVYRVASTLLDAYSAVPEDEHTALRKQELWLRYAGGAREIEGATLELRDVPPRELFTLKADAEPRPDGVLPTVRPSVPATPPTERPSDAGNVSNAALVVAAMRAEFQRCYVDSLAAQPDVQGRVHLALKVGADGAVARARAGGMGLPTSLLDCVLRRAALGKFNPPDGGAAVIVIPVTFVKN
jgi:hypothetical protein